MRMKRHLKICLAHDHAKPILMTVSGFPRAAWLFTREQKTVRMEVQHRRRSVRLLIFGPASKRTTLHFPDLITLLDYQAACDQHLASEGFILEHFVSERRR
jgi:hypothetical protein